MAGSEIRRIEKKTVVPWTVNFELLYLKKTSLSPFLETSKPEKEQQPIWAPEHHTPHFPWWPRRRSPRCTQHTHHTPPIARGFPRSPSTSLISKSLTYGSLSVPVLFTRYSILLFSVHLGWIGGSRSNHPDFAVSQMIVLLTLYLFSSNLLFIMITVSLCVA